MLEKLKEDGLENVHGEEVMVSIKRVFSYHTDTLTMKQSKLLFITNKYNFSGKDEVEDEMKEEFEQMKSKLSKVSVVSKLTFIYLLITFCRPSMN